MFTMNMCLPLAKQFIHFPRESTGSRIQNWARNPDRQIPTGKHSFVHIPTFILKGLTEIPFPSVHSLRQEAMIPKTTVLRQLTNSIQLKCCPFKRVPHMLTSERRQECVEGSRVLLETLEVHQQFEFLDIMTEDNS
jgi:hypothetical protein